MFYSLQSVLVLFLLLFSRGFAQCLSGYSLYREKCSKFFSVTATWANARTTCMNDGADLVSVRDADEMQYILSLKPQDVNGWIGLNDINSEGTFVWSNGASDTYRNWNSGEPNNSGGNEDCTVFGTSGKWNDASCADQNGFVCAYAASASPTSIPTATPTTSPIDGCMSGYSFYREKCTKFFSTTLTWADARTTCMNNGADLVSVRDADEMQYILSLKPQDVNGWIGLNDINSEDTFVWSNGATDTYRNWGSGEPNNSGGNEDCAVFGESGMWNDASCDEQQGFVCAYSISPTADCLSGYSFYRDKCSKFSSTTITWTNARTMCMNDGGDLISIRDDDEMQHTLSLVGDHPWTWIGLNDMSSEGNFVWADGVSDTYRNWKSGEPNDSSAAEDCTVFEETGLWVDWTCSGNNGYVCSYYAFTPSPTTATPNPTSPTSRPSKSVRPTRILAHPTTTPTNSPAANCLSGYSFYRGKCSKFSIGITTWANARTMCMNDGGDLISIRDDDEMQHILSLVGDHPWTWIGLNDMSSEGNFVWADGVSDTYRNWKSGEPNDSSAAEDCTVFEETGLWVDWTCSGNNGYVCSYYAFTPSPTTATPTPTVRPTRILASRPSRKPSGSPAFRPTRSPTTSKPTKTPSVRRSKKPTPFRPSKRVAAPR